ncbi:MAG TPA: hypothetical protein VFA26_09935 [Gemmataceae bacterium]|nr:hypothetical protein [Gemmataceae bacterium]
MAEKAATPSLPITVPPEVAEFAAEQGVTEYLPGVVEMTRRLYPGRTMALVVTEDPEIADDRHIVLEVDVTGMGVDQLVESHVRWSKEVFDHCPSTHVCVFRLGMVAMP